VVGSSSEEIRYGLRMTFVGHALVCIVTML
jgi:hypothetical protein